jgi:trans-feruloyl-CoA hydratase/vanillin synthase
VTGVQTCALPIYLYAKLDQAQLRDPEHGREQGLKQFLDDKTIKPGLQAYKR